MNIRSIASRLTEHEMRSDCLTGLSWTHQTAHHPWKLKSLAWPLLRDSRLVDWFIERETIASNESRVVNWLFDINSLDRMNHLTQWSDQNAISSDRLLVWSAFDHRPIDEEHDWSRHMYIDSVMPSMDLPNRQIWLITMIEQMYVWATHWNQIKMKWQQLSKRSTSAVSYNKSIDCLTDTIDRLFD